MGWEEEASHFGDFRSAFMALVDEDGNVDHYDGKLRMVTARNVADEMREIVAIAESAGAWVYADEVYRGAELDGVELKSFRGMSDRVMVAGGLSKAYALPGLRLGWLVGPEDTVSTSWAYHDYTSITAGILSHVIGEVALALILLIGGELNAVLEREFGSEPEHAPDTLDLGEPLAQPEQPDSVGQGQATDIHASDG